MKRVFDFTASVLGLILLSPVLLVIFLLVLWFHGKPVLFIQKRPGLDGKPFQIYKFRTMTSEMDEKGNLLPNEKRLTKFGEFLRSTSLDELPELLNVVKGEMSLVGPRPLMMRYLPLYNEFQSRRHEVLPGITGWAQVNGRNAIDWETRFELDVWYVENRTFWLDIKILMKTVVKIFSRSDITHEGEFMHGFTGSENN